MSGSDIKNSGVHLTTQGAVFKFASFFYRISEVSLLHENGTAVSILHPYYYFIQATIVINNST
jgi:hypothetical protein